MSGSTLDLTIKQGETFSKALSWFGGGKVCKVIEDLTSGCPVSINITAHGIPNGSDMPVFIDHVGGATRVNTKPNSPIIATFIDVDNFFVDADTVGQTYTANTGLVTYFAPTNLTGYSARMDIRGSIDDTAVIVSLVSPADITLEALLGKITIVIAAAVTALFTFDTAVYDLELIDGTGVVTRLVEGEIELCKEVTR